MIFLFGDVIYAGGLLRTESCNLFTTSIKNSAEKAMHCEI